MLDCQIRDIPRGICEDTFSVWREGLSRYFLYALDALPDLLQKESPVAIVRETLKSKGVVGLYTGCTALMVGNAAKAGIRFVSYDYFKGLLADSQVCGTPIEPSHPSNLRSRVK
jgi:hypothetical protein